MVQASIGKVATLLTKPMSRGQFFTHDDLLNTLGLEGGKYEAGVRTLSLGDGIWDTATGGAIAVRTNVTLSEDNRLKHLSTKYLALNPSGDYTENKLVEIDVRTLGNKQKISKMTFLGRSVDVAATDSVSRVLGVLQFIHSEIRNHNMPDIGQALHDYQVSGILGERMHVPGLGRQGGFDFQPISRTENSAVPKPVQLPQEYIRELLGVGVNDFDPYQSFGASQERTGVNRQNGGAFKAKVQLNKVGESEQMTASITPINAHNGKAITDLLHLVWKQTEDSAVIECFMLLGENSLRLSPDQRHKRLGVVNAMNRDLRRRKYPSLPDHVAAFNQQDLLDRQALTGQLDNQIKMVVKVYGGHNAREYLPGFGGTIGGNSKGVLGYYLDEDKQVRNMGVRVDAGITFSKQGGIQAGEHGSWDRVLPDPGADLANLKHDLVTHLHADHMQAIVDEARCGLQVGRTVHAAEYDIRVLQGFFKKEKVAPELWPKLNALNGEGWLHLDDGKSRVLSAYYSTNAIPHSTPVTAYIIAPAPYKCDKDGCATGGKMEPNPNYWSYATMGDMSFGPYNLPNYDGEKPPDTGFKEEFFSKFKSGLRKEYPDLPAEMRGRVNRINVAECDPTSVHREGFSPDVLTFEKNLLRLNGWFSDLGIILHSLSTAKREHEGAFRVAVKMGRNISGEGAYLENRMTDMNVMGVNTDVIPRNPDGGNINAYLEWYAAKNNLPPVAFHRRTSGDWRNLVTHSPHKTLVFATGSQGGEVEQDSVGTQISEGWSRFQLDPKYCRSAFGVDLKRYVSIYAQSAIPGNEDKQLDQLRKTAYENDQMVAVAVHDGARFYNLKEPYLSRIKEDFDKTGQRYTVEPMNGLYLHNFSLYPPGHGWKEDWRQGFLPWFKKNGVDTVSVQHYPRLESVKIIHGLADEIGLEHPTEPLPNHVAWTIENGKDFKILGHFTPSFILARDNRRYGKYYGGTSEYLHAVFPSSEGGGSDSGLFVAANSVYFNKFGQGDYEQALYEANLAPVRSRRDPDAGVLEMPPDLGASRIRPTLGVSSPRPLRNHPHLKAA